MPADQQRKIPLPARSGGKADIAFGWDLLTEEEAKELRENLAEMARLRRRAHAAAKDVVL